MFTIGYITCKKCDDFQQIFANDNLDEDLFCYDDFISDEDSG